MSRIRYARPMASEPASTEATSALVEKFFEFMPMVVAHINDRLEPLDLTNNDQWALRTIDGPMPMKELASCMEFDPSYVTMIADRLEARGLVERQPHPTDRRVKNLVLTAKGKRLRAKLPDTLWSGDTVFSSLDTAQRAQLTDLLNGLIDANRPVED